MADSHHHLCNYPAAGYDWIPPGFPLAQDQLSDQLKAATTSAGGQIAAALQLVDRQPDLGIIIDHLAKPEIRKGRIDPAWKSGMVTEVLDPEIDLPTLRAYFEETLQLFGPDRILFGTDWPVCLLRVDSSEIWAGMIRGFVSELSLEESGAILHDNAVRIYGL